MCYFLGMLVTKGTCTRVLGLMVVGGACGCVSLSGLTGGERDAAADHAPDDARAKLDDSAGAGAHDAPAYAADAALGAYGSAVMADQPIAYYPMNETSGTVLHDLGPSHANGTYGASVVLGAAGLVTSSSDTSAQFPGGGAAANNIASVDPTSALEPPMSFSIELFVEEDVANPSMKQAIDLVSEGQDSNQPFSLQIAQSNQFEVWLPAVTTTADFTGTTVLAPGQAYQVVMTYDGTTARLYVDGQMEASGPAAGALDYSDLGGYGLGIGCGFDESYRYALQGRIGQVSLYGSALSRERVAAHWAAAGNSGGGGM
jgi:Concanavalin A-like lectin/glucanases superfamily